jgi:hypothetical protein
MKKLPATCIVFLVGLVILIGAIVYWVYQRQSPASLPFKKMTPEAFVALIGWLSVVALFVERAVEVIVMTLRDEQADLNEHAVEAAQEKYDKASNALPAALVSAATDPDKLAANNNVNSLHDALVAAQQADILYRAATKKIALQCSLTMSLIVSLAGVRALAGLFDTATFCRPFVLADILITGLLLAGGSEGVHRLLNVYTSFSDGLSTKLDANADQAVRSAAAVNPK